MSKTKATHGQMALTNLCVSCELEWGDDELVSHGYSLEFKADMWQCPDCGGGGFYRISRDIGIIATVSTGLFTKLNRIIHRIKGDK